MTQVNESELAFLKSQLAVDGNIDDLRKLYYQGQTGGSGSYNDEYRAYLLAQTGSTGHLQDLEGAFYGKPVSKKKAEYFDNPAPAIAAFDHPDLLLAYTMDNVSGSNLVDESPNGRNSNITGATFVTGLIDNAINFDGVDDRTQVPTTGLLTTEGALSIWTKTPNNRLASFTQAGIDDRYYAFQVSGGDNKARLYAFTASIPYTQIASTNAVPNDGNFHHVVFQGDGSSIEIWIDGVQETVVLEAGTLSDLYSWASTASTATIFEQGSQSQVPIAYAAGQQDILRLFDRKLTSQEVSDLYNAGNGI